MAEFKWDETMMHFSSYFNNFHGHLPGGFHRKMAAVDDDWKYGAPGAGARRGLTATEFHQDVDRTIAELGLDPETMSQLEKDIETRSDMEKFHAYILPLYVRLREKGYNHYPDLTA
jgi:hypothetical protein